MTGAQCLILTSKTDIFHLGMMLWTLASQQPLFQSLICTESTCQKGSLCNEESHSKPTRLHPLPEAIPQYYKDVMNSCVAEKPEDRPSARELLAKFPAESELLQASDRSGTPNNRGCSSSSSSAHNDNDLLAQARGVSLSVTCTYCNTDYIQEVNHFHCNGCDFGDFDLCQKCYDEGKHCFDDDHFLIELQGAAKGCALSGRYHSSPDSSGCRRIFEC